MLFVTKARFKKRHPCFLKGLTSVCLQKANARDHLNTNRFSQLSLAFIGSQVFIYANAADMLWYRSRFFIRNSSGHDRSRRRFDKKAGFMAHASKSFFLCSYPLTTQKKRFDSQIPIKEESIVLTAKQAIIPTDDLCCMNRFILRMLIDFFNCRTYRPFCRFPCVASVFYESFYKYSAALLSR